MCSKIGPLGTLTSQQGVLIVCLPYTSRATWIIKWPPRKRLTAEKAVTHTSEITSQDIFWTVHVFLLSPVNKVHPLHCWVLVSKSPSVSFASRRDIMVRSDEAVCITNQSHVCQDRETVLHVPHPESS